MQAPSFWQSDNVPGWLMAVGRAYGHLARWQQQRITARQVEVPVICVGNITLGGVGKTPIVQSITQWLQAAGYHPHILLRGYGGAQRDVLRVDAKLDDAALVGDEALLHAPYAPTWVGRRRDLSARAAISMDADCLVMDDGLQHPYLQRDVTLMVIDRAQGLGNGAIFPVGPLRESWEDAIAKAQALVMVGDPQTKLPPLPAHDLPVFEVSLQTQLPVQAAPAYLAFAGIGRPEKFFASLQQAGVQLLQKQAFADHHSYRESELQQLRQQAQQLQVPLVTTRKDWVRLPPLWQDRVHVADVRIHWENQQIVQKWLLDQVAIPHNQSS